MLLSQGESVSGKRRPSLVEPVDGVSPQGQNSALSKKSLHKIWQNNSTEDKDGGQWEGGGGLLIVCSTSVWEAAGPVHFLPLTNFIFNG